MAKQKFRNIESLRGIAAISVVFYHFNIGSHFNNVFFHNAWLMVDFFFVLSGFVIALNYRDRLTSIPQLVNFQKKRFLRLYPLHFIMLIAFLGIEIAKYIFEVKFGINANIPAFTSNDLTAFIANLMLVQNWAITHLTFNYPSWSISAEFFTYGIFGAIVLLAGKSEKKLYLFTILVVLISGLMLSEKGMSEDNVSGPLRCLYSFFIGVVTFKIFSETKQQKKSGSSIPSLLLIFVCIYSVIAFGNERSGVTILIPFVFALTILSLVLTSEQALINRALDQTILVYLGTVSYGIYMIHAFIWWIWVQSLKFIFAFPTETLPNGEVIVVVDNIYLADAISLLGVSVIIMLSHLSYQYFESRFTRV